MPLATVAKRTVSPKEADALRWAQTVGNAGGWELNKYPYERQWMVNISYLLGHQDIAYDRDTHRTRSRRLPKHRSNYTANKILTMVERAQAEMCESTAQWVTKPRTGSREDRTAARVGKKLLSEMWEVLDMQEEKIPEAVLWALTCGTSFFYNTVKSDPRTKERVYVDPQSGDTIAPSMLGDGVRAMLNQMGSYVDYMAPNPDVEVVSPFRIMPDPEADSLKKARWIQHWSTMNLDEVYERWGIVVPISTLPTGMLDYEHRLRSFFGPAHGAAYGATASVAPSANHTSVQEIISKPFVTKKHGKWIEYPQGRHVIIAGGVVIHDDINGFYEAGFANGFPITDFSWHKSPGRFWGEAPITQWLDGQKSYNDIRRREQDNFRVMGQPKWLSPFGANLKRKSINDSAGEVIEYNFMGGGKPETVTPTPYHPSIVQGLAQNALSDLQDASNQHNLMATSTPSEMRSGPMMQLAQEGDRLGRRPIVGRMEQCISRVGENLLITAAQVLSDTGFVELIGDEYGVGAETFRASALKNIRSVKVKRGSMESGSAATDAQKVMDAVQSGGLNPSGNAGDRVIFMDAMNYGGYDPDRLTVMAERNVAERENDAMMTMPGMPGFGMPPVNDTDDDIVHIQIHGEAMRSPSFRLMSQAQQEAIRGHYREHGKRVQAAIQDRERRTLIAKGAPGQKGTPSPPKRSGK